MHVSLVTSVGVVVDGVIVRRCHEARPLLEFDESASQASSVSDPGTSQDSLSLPAERTARRRDEELHYECKATGKPIHQGIFHAMDVLPFGFHSPSTVFSVVGRHTNRGLITSVTPSGLICVQPYGQTGPLTAQYVRTRLFTRTVQDEQQVALSQPWLTSVRTQSKSPAVMRALARFLRATGVHNGAAVAAANQAALANIVSLGSSSRGLHSRTPSNSLSGIVKPTTPIRASPRKGGGGGDMCAACQVAGPPTAGSPSGTDTSSAEPPADGRPDEDEAAAVATYDLSDVALPPPLSRARHTPPLKVGARVLARRFGCDRVLQPATVLAVTYDVAYRLRYDADGGVDEGVLHNDVLLVDDSGAETCTVRDRVIVALQLQTTVTVIEAMGGGRYRGVLVHDPSQEVDFTTRNLVAVSPLLVDALYASPKHVELFRSLDPTYSGQVRWKNVRHAILHMEHFGKSLSFQTLGEIQRDMCILRRHVEPQMLHKVPVQEEEMFLSFNDFEYVLLRALNPL